MRAAYVIAARELRERKRIFILAGALALVPLIVAALPTAANDRGAVMTMVAAILALALGYAVALALGATILVREVTERRFTFHLSKPVSPAAIWIGKSAAAVLTSVLCFAIVAVPAWLIASSDWRTIWFRSPAALSGVIAGMIVLFLISHTQSTMIRSRSPIVAIDFVCALIAAGALYLISRPLIGALNMRALLDLATIMAFVLIIVLALAPIWQISRGRADIRSSHAALSLFLWTSVGAALLIAGAYVAWLVTPSLSAVQPQWIVQSPDGKSAFVAGSRARGDYDVSFLVDVASGDYNRMSQWQRGQIIWSRNGRVTAWLKPQGFRSSAGDRELNVSVDGGPAIATGILVPNYASVVLSDEGSRVAVLSGSEITVHDIQQQRLLLAMRGLDPTHNKSAFFLGPDLVRVYSPAGDMISIWEVDVRTKSLDLTGTVAAPHRSSTVDVSADASLMFIRDQSLVADGRTGRTITKLPVANPHPMRSVMLSDGSTAAVELRDGTVTLHIFTPSGEALEPLVIPGVRALWLSAELEGEKLLARGFALDAEKRWSGGGTFVIDYKRGEIERFERGFWGPLQNFDADPRLTHLAGTQLVGLDAEKRLILWNAQTGERTTFPS